MPATFRFWTCYVAACSAAAAIDVGLCERCQRHFCADHAISPTHGCKPLDDNAWTAARVQELKALRGMINVKNLLRRASERNGDLPCELDTSDHLGEKRMGGMHVHLRIIFSNGTTWLARVLRQNYTSFSDDFGNLCLESECATLKWLESMKVPAPQLHDYGLRNDPSNEVGVAYMLIDELPGTPLLYLKPSEDQLRKVYKRYAEILCVIHEHPFEQIGCLSFQSDGNIGIGPIVGDRTGTFSQMGPFRCAREYYATWAEKYLDIIYDRQLFTPYSVNAYLIFKYLKELAERGRWNAFELSIDDGPFFLKHMDDKGDHILVDEEYNITGLIDWTFARVVPFYEAFGPSLLTAEMSDIYQGRAGQSRNDKLMIESIQTKSNSLARFADGPDLVRRFSFGLGMGMNMSWSEANALFRGILSTATGIDLEIDWEVWRQSRLFQWANDARLQALLINTGERQDDSTTKRIFENTQPPRHATCSIGYCTRPGVRQRSCVRCQRHLCSKHQSKEFHKCPSVSESINDEVSELLSNINTLELVKIGTQLQNGLKCRFELEGRAMMGCANYHAWLVFDNGDKWIVRVPRTGFTDVPSELVEYLVASEYATLKFLEPTKIPAPKPYGYGLASDPSNRVGVSYILMQAMPGKPYYASQVSYSQKQRVIEQLADIMIEIYKHPVPLVGSLVMEGERTKLSSVASNRFVVLGTYGPFETPLDYIISITEQYLDLIADGQVHHKYPLEAFLYYRFLRKNATKIASSDAVGNFFLKHVDDKGDHLLVDENLNITGIIDWQFARTVPAAEAFGPSYVTADLGALYSSNTGVTDDDRLLATALRNRGANELASYAADNELMRRFHHGLASGLSKNEARSMLKGMVEIIRSQPVDNIDAWITEQWDDCRSDPRFRNIQALLSEQNDYTQMN
ncbi:hypothetical protein N7474_000518 [Penicillium riverlandense]|uniref:uncharacterized protein n=1 Tax=Penicillium riverlandense TaxID=1903569 RepID=UPI0025484438|nr:uncharacterized protein N7474_000518 [Penicillium riverlandense]KAJ5832207.1 hypothetical protein N7474_000518 [Penicillium riverlandense]